MKKKNKQTLQTLVGKTNKLGLIKRVRDSHISSPLPSKIPNNYHSRSVNNNMSIDLLLLCCGDNVEKA